MSPNTPPTGRYRLGDDVFEPEATAPGLPAWKARGDSPSRGKGDPVNDFLTSLKADLSDRRLLPFVALVGACLGLNAGGFSG